VTDKFAESTKVGAGWLLGVITSLVGVDSMPAKAAKGARGKGKRRVKTVKGKGKGKSKAKAAGKTSHKTRARRTRTRTTRHGKAKQASPQLRTKGKELAMKAARKIASFADKHKKELAAIGLGLYGGYQGAKTLQDGVDALPQVPSSITTGLDKDLLYNIRRAGQKQQ